MPVGLTKAFLGEKKSGKALEKSVMAYLGCLSHKAQWLQTRRRSRIFSIHCKIFFLKLKQGFHLNVFQ